MSNPRKILLIMGSIAIVLAVLWVLLSQTPKEQHETQLYELSANKVFYYYGKEYFYIVLDLTAQYGGGGKWTIWRTGLKLVTDLGSVLEPDPVPPELKELCGFKNEMASSVNVTSYKPVRFQVAYIASPREKPVKLVYEEPGKVRTEVSLASTPFVNISYHRLVHYYSINVNTETSVPQVSALLLSGPEWRCFAPGSEFEVEIKVSRYRPILGIDTVDGMEFTGLLRIPVAITEVKAEGAVIVDVEPKPPVLLDVDESVVLRVRLRAPENIFKYFGWLSIAVAAELAESPDPSLFELVVNNVYYYRSGYSMVVNWTYPPEYYNTYLIFNLSVRYNSEGYWVVWRERFKLLTSEHRLLEPVLIPSELKQWCGFNGELIGVADITSHEYTRFLIAFVMNKGEKPVKLIYSGFHVKIEIPLTEENLTYLSYYYYLRVDKEAAFPLPYAQVSVSSPSHVGGCYVAGSELEVVVNVRNARLFSSSIRELAGLQSKPVNITEVKAVGAVVVGVEPRLPITVGVDERATLQIKLVVPDNYSHSGSLTIVLTIVEAG